MISEQVVNKTKELADKIVAKGKVAIAVPDTPLEILCNHTSFNGIYKDEQSLSAIVDESDNSIHNYYSDEYIKQISDHVAQHIDFAKNIVNPVIKEVASYVSQKMDNYTDNAINDIKVVRISDYDFLNNDDLVSDIKAYRSKKATSYYDPVSTFKLANKSYEAILEMMLTGSANLDMSIKLWASNLEKGLLEEVYDLYFCDPKLSSSKVTTSMTGYLNNPVDGHNAAIIIYLLARKLQQEIKQKQVEYTEDKGEYNPRVEHYLTVSAIKLNDLLDKLDTSAKNKDIIFYIDQNNKTIYVFSQTYMDWLDDGGSPEVLYGAFVKNSKDTNPADIDKNRDTYLKAWSTYKAAVDVKHRNDYLNRYIQALRDGFYNSYKNLSEAEQEFYQSNSDAKDQVAKLFEEELEYITLEDRKDHYRTVTKVVCKSRFYYTDVYNFLLTVDRLTLNDQMSLEQALHMAVIEYVTDYVSSQILIR